jgi:NADPH-dependent 2,4-dienoyl-CoA reductase/sulfur reductase-like enzyme
MTKYDVVVIGGGPSGIITGTTVKKQNPDKKVLLLTLEPKGLVPCGIPYIFHKLNSVEKNKMGPMPLIDAGGEVIIDRVEKVDFETKSISTESGKSFEYGKLVFATGSTPVVPTFIKGYDLENVFYIKKSYTYMEKVFADMQDKKNVVVVGGGFIGAEVAEQLSEHKDKTVTLIEAESQCFSKAFSPELSEIATNVLKETNTNVLTGKLVSEIEGKDGKVSKVKLNDGTEIEADAVVLSIGYKPNVEIAEKAGLQINKFGAIIVDNYSRTPQDDVCAVGDCSQTLGFLTGKFDNIMLASTATAEARVLGYNLFGVKIKKNFKGTLGVFSTKIGDYAMAAAGINEHNAKEAQIEFVTTKFSDIDRHPGTLADTSPLTVKLYASPLDGTILGGEAWGSSSAGEIINIISMAIQKNVTVYELVSFQIGTHPLLTYAPTKPAYVKAAEMAIQAIKKYNK